MVGGGSRREDGSLFWAPTPLTVKSWADVDDDDDYYATTAPPQSIWGSSEPSQSHEDKAANVETFLLQLLAGSQLGFSLGPSKAQDSESEEDILDEGDYDMEEEHDHEPEVPVHPEPVQIKAPEVPAAPKEAERQLSKKERKKKELAELEALLADFGVAPKESNDQDESRGESKSAKKKKKKDKSKEGKEPQDQPTNADATNGPDEAAVTATEQTEEDTSAVDVKERLKKMASMKKKKSSKEMDAAAKAAAQEAAARSAKLAAAKKKEKNHYNQHPVR
ncbi:hypothetical protein COLO4_24069 [Corchorus olitorius]|uniref:Copper ion binding protein n=1 Tax=Corchorus olitorius TaxID=93759 RepID=A0A1R3ID09_9ROSI|nr:hypothetical protein COLO4_24069 [Corchorus olitorius]